MAQRRTRTSEHANHFLLTKPHGDLAIANCIAQQLIANKTYDASFVSKYCNFRADAEPSRYDSLKDWDDYKTFGTLLGKPITFDQYQQMVAPYTPEKVSELSGVSVADLQMLGKLFANRQVKILSLWCMGMNQHTMGTAINNLVHGIHLLSGHFGKPGDGPQSLTGQPSACGTVREVGTLCHALPGDLKVEDAAQRGKAEHLWNLPDGRINPKIGYHTVLMWEKFCTPSDKGGDIDTLWVQVTNPGQSLPMSISLSAARRSLRISCSSSLMSIPQQPLS